jgi:hypothetical protein
MAARVRPSAALGPVLCAALFAGACAEGAPKADTRPHTGAADIATPNVPLAPESNGLSGEPALDDFAAADFEAAEFTSADPLVRRRALREQWLAIQQGEDRAARAYDLMMSIRETDDGQTARRLVLFALDADRAIATEAARVILERRTLPAELERVIRSTVTIAERRNIWSVGATDDQTNEETMALEGQPEMVLSIPLLRGALDQTTDPRACKRLLQAAESLPTDHAAALLEAQLDATAGCGVERRAMVLAALGRLQRRNPELQRIRERLEAEAARPKDAFDRAMAEAALGNPEASIGLPVEDAARVLVALTSAFEPDQSLRIRAVNALGQNRSARAQNRLEGMLLRLKESPAVLEAVLQALEARDGGLSPAVVPLLEAFTSPLEGKELRAHALELIARGSTR